MELVELETKKSRSRSGRVTFMSQLGQGLYSTFLRFGAWKSVFAFTKGDSNRGEQVSGIGTHPSR